MDEVLDELKQNKQFQRGLQPTPQKEARQQDEVRSSENQDKQQDAAFVMVEKDDESKSKTADETAKESVSVPDVVVPEDRLPQEGSREGTIQTEPPKPALQELELPPSPDEPNASQQQVTENPVSQSFSCVNIQTAFGKVCTSCPLNYIHMLSICPIGPALLLIRIGFS